MHQVAVDAEHTNIDLAVIGPERCDVGDAK
jgi:hypothetical protein